MRTITTMTRDSDESRRCFLGLTGGLAALGLFGSGTVSADEKEEKDGKRGRSNEVTAFDVELAPENVVSDEDVESDATGNATAVLDGYHLLIGGEFADLESRLRDLEDYDDEGFGTPEEDDEDQEEVVEDLLDPGIHIHEGGPDETTGYVLALVAHLEEFDDRDARFAGSFLLSRSQIVTLENEEMYQDVHTEGFEDGELRDQISPVNRELRLFDAELTSEAAGVDAPALGEDNGISRRPRARRRRGVQRSAQRAPRSERERPRPGDPDPGQRRRGGL
jgi:hypothetical protein